MAGAGATALGVFFAVLGDGLFDPVTFGDRVAASLDQPAVAAVAADWMTGAVLEQKPDLTPFRPLVLAAAHGLATTPAFRGVVRAAARSAHQGVFAEGTRRVMLSLPDLGILLRSAMAQGHPELAERMPDQLQAFAAVLGDDIGTTVVIELWELRSQVETLAFATGAAGLLLLVMGAGLHPDRYRGFANAGVALVAAGLAVWAALPLGRIGVGRLASEPALAPALQGLWSTFSGGLASGGVFLGGLGLLLAAASSSLLESWEPVSWARDRLRALARTPATRRARLGRGAALVAVGAVAVAAPGFTVTAGVVVVGATLAFLGARELFRAAADAAEANPVAARVQVRGLAGTLGVVGLAAFGLALALAAQCDRPVRPTSVSTCNGSEALCGRRLDEVSLAGTHNAMSHMERPDWLYPQQQAGIPKQLEDGIRALLIDVHYGYPGASRVKTDLEGARPTTAALEEALGAEGVAAAYRIRETLIGADLGRRGLYLCHGLCELGAYELVPTLREIRSFLVGRPDAVLVIVVEDYVSPEDLAAAFEESGLAQQVYTGSASPWPRLRQLVRAGRPVVVFLESGRPGIPWLRPAFADIQETPYSFRTPEEFSCRPNRGATRGSLFQINHWITPTTLPPNAARLNAYEPLLDRARECQKERRHLPNVLAVDFYRSGDVLRVVDTLNGVGPIRRSGAP